MISHGFKSVVSKSPLEMRAHAALAVVEGAVLSVAEAVLVVVSRLGEGVVVEVARVVVWLEVVDVARQEQALEMRLAVLLQAEA